MEELLHLRPQLLTRLLLLMLSFGKGFLQDARMPPDIFIGPPKYKIYRDAETIRLDCASGGLPAPWFSWHKDGQELDPNDPSIRWVQPNVNGSIDIIDANGEWAGHYQCLARNAHGTAVSNVSFLEMAFLDRFPAPDIATYFKTEGEQLVLPCDELKSIPHATYSWAMAVSTEDKNPVLFLENDRVRIDDFGNLHFAYVKKQDEYGEKLYKCHVYNSVLDITMGGSYANLSVTATSPIPTSSPRPAFHTNSPMIGVVGGSVKMACLFYGNPVPKVDWKKSNGTLPPPPRWMPDASSHSTEVTISNLEVGDAGDYVCTGSSDYGTATSTINLRVEAQPSFIVGVNHLRSRNITEAESVIFTCAAEGIPTPQLTWFRNGQPLDKNALPSDYHLSADGLTLTISQLCKTCPDGSSSLTVIQCNARNVHGYDFAQGFVNVLRRTVVNNSSVTVHWEPEKEFLFPCFATFDDLIPVTYNWFLNGSELEYSDSIYFSGEVLHIKTGSDVEADKELLGNYRCSVTNSYSEGSVDHFLLSSEEENTECEEEENNGCCKEVNLNLNLNLNINIVINSQKISKRIKTKVGK